MNETDFIFDTAKFHMVLPFVVAIIKDSSGRILIGQHKDLERKPYPLFWDLPGGKLEPNETSEQGILREVEEELGVKAKIIALVGVFHHSQDKFLSECKSKIPGIAICYEVLIEGDIVPTEQDNVHYASVDELHKMRLTPWTRHFVNC